MIKKIPASTAREIIGYFDGIMLEYESIFKMARDWSENHQEESVEESAEKIGEKFSLNGQNIEPDRFSRLLIRYYAVCHSSLEIRISMGSDQTYSGMARISSNAWEIVEKLKKLLEETPGAKVPSCPPEVAAWLEKEKEAAKKKKV